MACAVNLQAHDQHVLETIWKSVDTDQSGTMELEELGQVLQKMGRCVRFNIVCPGLLTH
eukprot:SAG22_NODE_1089_length_5599_cov_19.018179_3_plen_59_part_00